jgi:hypothetical protein
LINWNTLKKVRDAIRVDKIEVVGTIGFKPTTYGTQNLFLNKAGVATTAGSSFGGSGEGYLRFSYAHSSENILVAVKRIKIYFIIIVLLTVLTLKYCDLG